MGFETGFHAPRLPHPRIMKPSLWDLKHDIDIVKGFTPAIMKPSLWDLKLRKEKTL